MANLYGVANAPGYGLEFTNVGNADVICTHDVFTPVFVSSPWVAPSQGYFYAIAWAMMNIDMGAAPATGFNCAIAIGAGSYGPNTSIGTFGMVASTYYWLTFPLVSQTSQAAWQGAGSTITVGLSPGVNTVTVKAFSACLAMFYRAPDQ